MRGREIWGGGGGDFPKTGVLPLKTGDLETPSLWHVRKKKERKKERKKSRRGGGGGGGVIWEQFPQAGKSSTKNGRFGVSDVCERRRVRTPYINDSKNYTTFLHTMTYP